jgi:uncharacterized damage-inducible protein DinB
MSDTSASVLSTPGTAFDDLDSELASTRRILERFPDDKGDWGPHDKSRTIGQLAAHVANLPSMAAMILQTDHLDVMKRQPTPAATKAADLVAFFDSNVAMLKNAIANAPPDELTKSWSLKAGDRALITQTKRALLRVMFLSHMIHHRAQLGVYYRLLGVPVPGVYGPTADEPI